MEQFETRWMTWSSGFTNGSFIEKQTIEMFGLNDREFEHNYRVEPAALADSVAGDQGMFKGSI
jgi:hypothetical protein